MSPDQATLPGASGTGTPKRASLERRGIRRHQLGSLLSAAPAEPQRRGSRHPFHELANVIVTPHNSGWTTGMVRRRWDEIADNIGRCVRGEPPINVVTTI